MSEKILNARFQQKTDTTDNWNIAGRNGFIPKKGEIICYQDIENSKTTTKIKVGDGYNTVTNLPFQDQFEIDTTLTASGKAADAKVVGDKIAQSKKWNVIENKPTIDSGSGTNSIKENDLSNVAGNYSHAEGWSTYATNYSHAEGYDTTATNYSHAEGYNTNATNYSHAEGSSTQAIGTSAHAEGELTVANGEFSHAEGHNSRASGYNSHAEGEQTTASGWSSHAEGYGTVAGNYSHAEGDHTYAVTGSHAEGLGTLARGQGQHVQGKYNRNYGTPEAPNAGNFAHVVGNGTSDTDRRNIHTLDWDGNAWFAGDVYTGSTSGTQKDQGSKILATKEYVDDSLQELKDAQLGVQDKIVAESVLISKEPDDIVTNFSLLVDGSTCTQSLLAETIAADSISFSDVDEEGLVLSTSLDANGIRTNGDYFVFPLEGEEEICSVLGNKTQIDQHAQEIQKIKDEYYSPDNQPDYPVVSVNGKNGDVTLTAEDVGALPNTTVIPTVPDWAKEQQKPTYTAAEVGALPSTTIIPTKVSQLTNDSGFITSAPSSRIRVVRVPTADEGGQPGTIKLEENTVYQFLSGSEPKVLKCYNSDNEVTNTLSYQMFTIYCGGMGDNNHLVEEGSLDKRAKQAYLVYIANNTKSNSILGLPDYDAGYLVFKKNWPGTDNVNENFRVEVSYPAGSVYMIQSQEV